jgi:hypothetical protein
MLIIARLKTPPACYKHYSVRITCEITRPFCQPSSTGYGAHSLCFPNQPHTEISFQTEPRKTSLLGKSRRGSLLGDVWLWAHNLLNRAGGRAGARADVAARSRARSPAITDQERRLRAMIREWAARRTPPPPCPPWPSSTGYGPTALAYPDNRAEVSFVERALMYKGLWKPRRGFCFGGRVAVGP